MSQGSKTWHGEADEDGNFTALNRLCSLAGSGSEVVRGEGNVLLQADVSAITCRVFELASRDAEPGAEVLPAPTLTPAANIFDALRTVGWKPDLHGYNFRHDLGAAYFADPDEWRLIEYKLTLAGGTVIWVKWRVKAAGTGSS